MNLGEPANSKLDHSDGLRLAFSAAAKPVTLPLWIDPG